jgi:hypothetical protein
MKPDPAIPSAEAVAAVLPTEYSGLIRPKTCPTLPSNVREWRLLLYFSVSLLLMFGIPFVAYVANNGLKYIPWGEAVQKIALLLLGLGFLYHALKNLHVLWQLRVAGQQTEAILFDSWQDEDLENGTIYLVAYAFKTPTPEGPQIITRAEQNQKVYENYRVGGSLTVCYLPKKPEISRVVFDRE